MKTQPLNRANSQSDIMPPTIHIEQPDQVVNAQPPQLSSLPFAQCSIGQFPLILLQVSNTFINAIFDAEPPHIHLSYLSNSMTSVYRLVLCLISLI